MNADEITILIVDDEPALREIFGGWVKSMHRGKVLTAADGLDAFEILKSTNVALLITDVGMPRMDGLNLVRRLSELANTPRVIFVSAFSDVNQREMYELGAESILAKPLRKEDLIKTVTRALTMRSELWPASPHLLPRQSIVIGDPSGYTTTGESYFALGQGGFCARYSEVIALGTVNF
jgi:CheY-like chemotaxis protein